MDGTTNGRNRAAFSNFSGEVWTMPWIHLVYLISSSLAATFDSQVAMKLSVQCARLFRNIQTSSGSVRRHSLLSLSDSTH